MTYGDLRRFHNSGRFWETGRYDPGDSRRNFWFNTASSIFYVADTYIVTGIVPMKQGAVSSCRMPSAISRPQEVSGRHGEQVRGEHDQSVRGLLVSRSRMLKFMAATIVLSGAICVLATLLTFSGEARELRALAVRIPSRIGGSAHKGDPSTIPYSTVTGSSSVAEVAIPLGSTDNGGIRAVEDRLEQTHAGTAPPQQFGNIVQDAGTQQQLDEAAWANVGVPQRDGPPQLCGDQDAETQVEKWSVLGQAGECPRCDSMFEKLDWTKHGTSIQDVSMQLRGEPKSGTGFMYEWAVNALMHTCSALNELYGQRACSLTWSGPKSKGQHRAISRKVHITHMKEVLLEFEPANMVTKDTSPAPCKCEIVDRVSVRISSLLKHDLPVPSECPWQHVDGVTGEGRGCVTVDGREVRNHEDTAKCVRDSPCDIVDNRMQMLILRDPRATVVSMYYFGKKTPGMSGQPQAGESVESFALRMLPTVCGFVHLRYLLLLEMMPDKTVEFIYDESLVCPVGWHKRFVSSLGLVPPWTVLRNATNTALRNDFEFMTKGIDAHPGGMPVGRTRSFEDEISAEVKARLDDICRVWLPPVLLNKFGIAFEDRSSTAARQRWL